MGFVRMVRVGCIMLGHTSAEQNAWEPGGDNIVTAGLRARVLTKVRTASWGILRGLAYKK
jgi:hypothetical protein